MLRNLGFRRFSVVKWRIAGNLRRALITVTFLLSQLSFYRAPIWAQGAPNPLQRTQGARVNDVEQDYCEQRALLLTVLNDSKGHLDRQSVIMIHDPKTDTKLWQTTNKESQATICDLNFGDYDLEISAVGFITEHKVVHISPAIQKLRVEVQLRRNPSAVELSASDDAIPKKERKNAEHAVYALKSGNLKEAQKRLEKLYKVVPSSAQVNFLYGYLYLQRNDTIHAETYLTRHHLRSS